MKRILFAPIVDEIHGSLTGKQALQYARSNNPAWYSPANQRNTARNYKANYIAKVSKRTGNPYLVIRKKTTINMSDPMVLQMAVQGGAAAVYTSLMEGSQAADAIAMYEYEREHATIPANWSLRKYWWQQVYALIRQKQTRITARVGGYTVTIDNPWQVLTGTLNCPVSDEIRAKFWLQLGGSNYQYCTITDRGIKYTMLWNGSDALGSILTSNYNTLGILMGSGGDVTFHGLPLGYKNAGTFISLNPSNTPRTEMFTQGS